LVIGCWSQGGSPRTMRCCQSLYSIALPPFVYMYILGAFSKARPSYRGPGDDVQKTSIVSTSGNIDFFSIIYEHTKDSGKRTLIIIIYKYCSSGGYMHAVR